MCLRLSFRPESGRWFRLIHARVPGSTTGHGWSRVIVEAAGPSRPGLRVEVAAGRRLLLRQGGQVVLLGLQRAGHRGVYYARTGLYRSPLPPISAALARRFAEIGAGEGAGDWAACWAHQFSRWLRDAVEGPLHVGRWTQAAGMPEWNVPQHWLRLRASDRDQGHISWFGYGDPVEDIRDVLPLRRLSPADAARVKSCRRQVREGIAPPALLWWVSGLNTLVVLDGHDRIVAALAEETCPR